MLPHRRQNGGSVLPGAVLSITYDSSIPGFPKQYEIPSLLAQEAGYANNNGYMSSTENLNTFIYKLNIAAKGGTFPPQLRFGLWGITILCFFGFIMSSMIPLAVFHEPPSIAGIIVCFIGFGIFGIFLPASLGFYYRSKFTTDLQNAISLENQIATRYGFHW